MEEARIDGGSANGSEGPKIASMSIDEEAVIVALRRHTLLPLDDCLYAL